MANLAALARPAVEALLQDDEDALYQQLGVRVAATKINPAVGGSFQPDLPALEMLGPMDAVGTMGRRIFDRMSHQAYALACGSEAENSQEREQLLASFGLNSKEAVAAALAALLVAQIGMAAAIAAVVATLVVKLFFSPVYEATCETWKENLPERIA